MMFTGGTVGTKLLVGSSFGVSPVEDGPVMPDFTVLLTMLPTFELAMEDPPPLSPPLAIVTELEKVWSSVLAAPIADAI
jgi:hypothetical protein